MDLYEYVLDHTIRGECMCGRCVDAVENPERNQPDGHTVDLVFFKVAGTGLPDRGTFERLVDEQYAHWLDGREHSYLEIGADIGDQGVAMQAMGLGHLLGVWTLLTPRSMLPGIDDDLALRMAGSGMITIQQYRSETDGERLQKYILKGGRRRTMTDTLLREQAAAELKLRFLDDILVDLYEYLITMSWESSDTLDEYQDAWKKIAEILKVGAFDWTSGERPHSSLSWEENDE